MSKHKLEMVRTVIVKVLVRPNEYDDECPLVIGQEYTAKEWKSSIPGTNTDKYTIIYYMVMTEEGEYELFDDEVEVLGEVPSQ